MEDLIRYQRESHKLAELEAAGFALYRQKTEGTLGYNFYLAYEPAKVIVGQFLMVDSAVAILNFHFRWKAGVYDCAIRSKE